jgi:hypothetical protein
MNMSKITQDDWLRSSVGGNHRDSVFNDLVLDSIEESEKSVKGTELLL